MGNESTIALFAFNRPAHTARVLEALGRCAGASESRLVVHIDGPRTPDDVPAIEQVSSLFKENLPFRQLSVDRSPVNKGLYRSITEGVSAILEHCDDVIVIEDDIVVAEDFLSYMRDALSRFRDDPRVGCIHGYAIPGTKMPDFYFLRGGDCWGWATWRDRWGLFEDNPMELLQALVRRRALDEFMATQGAASLRMLGDRAMGRNESWAILWHTSLWLAGRFTLHPGASFVQNIGNDGSGTHTPSSDYYRSPLRQSYGGIPNLEVAQDPSAAMRSSAFYDDANGLLGRTRAWLNRRRARQLASRIGQCGG